MRSSPIVAPFVPLLIVVSVMLLASRLVDLGSQFVSARRGDDSIYLISVNCPKCDYSQGVERETWTWVCPPCQERHWVDKTAVFDGYTFIDRHLLP